MSPHLLKKKDKIGGNNMSIVFICIGIVAGGLFLLHMIEQML